MGEIEELRAKVERLQSENATGIREYGELEEQLYRIELEKDRLRVNIAHLRESLAGIRNFVNEALDK